MLIAYRFGRATPSSILALAFFRLLFNFALSNGGNSLKLRPPSPPGSLLRSILVSLSSSASSSMTSSAIASAESTLSARRTGAYWPREGERAKRKEVREGRTSSSPCAFPPRSLTLVARAGGRPSPPGCLRRRAYNSTHQLQRSAFP